MWITLILNTFQESICSSKDATSALTGKKSASLYFHQICDELPPFSTIANQENTNNCNTNNKNNGKNSADRSSDTNINNNNKNSVNYWQTSGGNSDLRDNISASLESNLPGNQLNIGGNRDRKQSLTVPEEIKFHPHYSRHHHHHHHQRSSPHSIGTHSADHSPEHISHSQHYLPLISTHHSHQHHQRASSMGHQQLEHRSDEGTIEETTSPKCKIESSRSPSPLSTPSPSGSTSL